MFMSWVFLWLVHLGSFVLIWRSLSFIMKMFSGGGLPRAVTGSRSTIPLMLLLWIGWLLWWELVVHQWVSLELYKTQRKRNQVLVAQKCHNSFGRILSLSEYGHDMRTWFIIVPKGFKGEEWRSLEASLRMVAVTSSSVSRVRNRASEKVATIPYSTMGMKGSFLDDKVATNYVGKQGNSLCVWWVGCHCTHLFLFSRVTVWLPMKVRQRLEQFLEKVDLMLRWVEVGL